MAYKKPQIIAKSEAQQSYVAGCPTYEIKAANCSYNNYQCDCGPLE